MSFTHLHLHSNFSFYDGAAPLDQVLAAACEMGMGAIALTDHNSLAGAVRFYKAASKAGMRPIIGVEFTVEGALGKLNPSRRATGPVSGELSSKTPNRRALHTFSPNGEPSHLILLAADNAGYSSLCRLVTCAQLGSAQSLGPFAPEYQEVDRKNPLLSQADLQQYCRGLLGLSGCARGEIARLVAQGRSWEAGQIARYYAELLGEGNFYIELQHHLLAPPQGHLRYRLREFAEWAGLPVVATNNVHYVTRAYAPLQDALICLKHNQTVDQPHPERKPNWEYDLKPPEAMAALFADMPEALRATEEIAERCQWSLDLGSLHLPRFDPSHLDAEGAPLVPAPCESDANYLRRLCEQALPAKYPWTEQRGAARAQLDHELALVEGKGLAGYFLIVWDIVRFADRQGIRHTGRGSAADSIICYLLDMTHVEPLSNDLLFERFLNPHRTDLPDIDLDFDARRRDEVTAYIYRKYGAAHVAAVATVNTFRARAAVRELGAVMGYPEREIDAISRMFAYVSLSKLEQSLQALPEVRGGGLPLDDKQIALRLCHQVGGFPRHLAVHVGGLVITPGPGADIMPLQLSNKGIVVSQYDKDDIEALGLMKMDILGLRTHTAIEQSLKLLRRRGVALDLERVPLDDSAPYALLRETRSIGLFQLESPGQRNLAGRTQPTEFEDIVANISLFRPGPVQADMIKPYVARRRGLEPVTHLHPALEPILGPTYGVIIYQEQVLRVAAAIGGFTLGEGDLLRRAMTHDIAPEEMFALKDRFVSGALERGVSVQVAEKVFGQICGFAAYGFNKAHAASFAKIAYQTAYLKAYYPAEYIAGLLSAQPMGFYPARTLAEEAKRCGVGILPPCVNRSEGDYTVEDGAIRCGLSFMREMPASGVRSLLEAREKDGPFASLADFCARVKAPYPAVRNLILAGAFAATGRSIAELLEELAAMRRGTLTALDPQAGEPELLVDIEQSPFQRLQWDLYLLGISTGVSPFGPFVEQTERAGAVPAARLLEHKHGETVKVAGIVVARARPPTRSGKTAIFLCLEDHTGLVDIAIFEDAYQRFGSLLYSAPALMAEGKLTRLGVCDNSITVQKLWSLRLPRRGEAEAAPADPGRQVRGVRGLVEGRV